MDDRRVISGIIHVLRVGYRWEDCPPEYGPPTTVYNRFNGWSHRGLCGRIFATLAAQAELPRELSIDSTAVRAHRSAHGGKGGANSGHRALAWRPDHQNPRPDRWLRTGGGLYPQPRKSCRHLGGPALLDKGPAPARLLADKGYDANSLRKRLAATKTEAVTGLGEDKHHCLLAYELTSLW